jgi:hypothetical protein
MKTARARRTDRTTFYDVRNNLRVVARYLPDPYYMIYRRDWIQRYDWLAARDGHGRAFARGERAGRWRGMFERLRCRSRRLGPDALEHFFCWDRIRRGMADLADSGIRRIVLADLGKNCYPYYRGARLAGISVSAVADDRFTAPGRHYRGIPILPADEALESAPEAIVVSNTSSVHATATATRLKSRTSRPVFDWLGTSERTDPAVAAVQVTV